MAFSKMQVTITVVGTGPKDLNLQSVQAAIARTLRSEGVITATDTIQVQGKLG